jgi:hypothetical protein
MSHILRYVAVFIVVTVGAWEEGGSGGGGEGGSGSVWSSLNSSGECECDEGELVRRVHLFCSGVGGDARWDGGTSLWFLGLHLGPGHSVGRDGNDSKPPLSDSVSTKEMLQYGFGDFYFYEMLQADGFGFNDNERMWRK